jgi:hypothetical protein
MAKVEVDLQKIPEAKNLIIKYSSINWFRLICRWRGKVFNPCLSKGWTNLLACFHSTSHWRWDSRSEWCRCRCPAWPAEGFRPSQETWMARHARRLHPSRMCPYRYPPVEYNGLWQVNLVISVVGSVLVMDLITIFVLPTIRSKSWCWRFLAGRVRKGPAPLNLEIPEYSFADENTLIIG